MKLAGRICIIDNDQAHLQYVHDICSTNGLVSVMYTDSTQLLNRSEPYDILITEAELDGDSGFDICNKIKSNKATEHVSVIFISEIEDTETIVAAYEVGATAYLVKPIIPTEFIHHLDSVLRSSKMSKKLQKTATLARKTAFDSMIESERLHAIIEFVQASSHCKSLRSVADVVFEMMARLKLRGSILFHLNNEDTFFTDDGKPHQFEKSFLLDLRSKIYSGNSSNLNSRFFSANNRAAASFANCSMFVRSSGKSEASSLLDFIGLFMNQLDKTVDRVRQENKIIHYISITSQSMPSFSKYTHVALELCQELSKNGHNQHEQKQLIDKLIYDIKNLSEEINLMNKRLALIEKESR